VCVCVCVHASAISSQLFLFTPPMEAEQSVPKRRHIIFRGRGITQTQHSHHGESLK